MTHNSNKTFAILQSLLSKPDDGWRLTQTTQTDVYKELIVNAGLHGYNDYMLILATDEGDLFTIDSDVKKIIKTMVKYWKEGKLNATAKIIKAYENEMTRRVRNGKLAVMYISNVSKRPLDYGASQIIAINDIEAFKRDKNEIARANFYANDPVGKLIDMVLKQCE